MKYQTGGPLPTPPNFKVVDGKLYPIKPLTYNYSTHTGTGVYLNHFDKKRYIRNPEDGSYTYYEAHDKYPHKRGNNFELSDIPLTSGNETLGKNPYVPLPTHQGQIYYSPIDKKYALKAQNSDDLIPYTIDKKTKKSLLSFTSAVDAEYKDSKVVMDESGKPVFEALSSRPEKIDSKTSIPSPLPTLTTAPNPLFTTLRNAVLPETAVEILNNFNKFATTRGDTMSTEERAFRERIARTVHPLTYNTADKMERYKSNKDVSHVGVEISEDLFRLYLGLPQKYNNIRTSDYQFEGNPAHTWVKGKFDDALRGVLERHPTIVSSGKFGKSGKNLVATTGSFNQDLGNYTVGIGEDEKGEYISIYDKWDLEPVSSKGAIGLDLNQYNNPPIIYDRRYRSELSPDLQTKFDEMKKKYPAYQKKNFGGDLLKIAAPLASFIPGVGPVLSPALSALGSTVNNLSTPQKIQATNIGYATGGALQPLSSTSSVVKANNPNSTDSVHLPQQNISLDHNEVVANNFVFSDALTHPVHGKTFAALALPLQKAKGKNEGTTDPIAQKTVHIANTLTRQLANEQESLATSLGLRSNPAPASYYQGGPIRPPHTDALMSTSLSKKIFYDPYTGYFFSRNRNGLYTKYETSDFDLSQYKPKDADVTEHVNKFPYPVSNFSTPTQSATPLSGGAPFDFNTPTINSSKPFVEPTTPTTPEHKSAPSSTPLLGGAPFVPEQYRGLHPDQSTPQAQIYDEYEPSQQGAISAPPTQPTPNTGTRRVRRPATSSPSPATSYPTTSPTTSPTYQVDLSRALPTFINSRFQGVSPRNTADLEGVTRAQAELPTIPPNTNPLPRILTEQAAGPVPPALDGSTSPFLPTRYRLEGINDFPTVDTSKYKIATPPSPVPPPSPDNKSPFTTGDVFSVGALAANTAMNVFNKPREYRPQYDTTPITKQTYDPSRILSQNNLGYQQALTTNQTSSAPLNRAIAANLFSNKMEADANTITQYNQMNNQATTQYQQLLSNQQRYNNQQYFSGVDYNNRAKDQRLTNISSSFADIASFGQSLNERKSQLEMLELLRKVYPNIKSI